jgi:hypothetical protein
MKYFFISDGHDKIGPLSKHELYNKNITKETLIWYEGLRSWEKAGDVEELADLFLVQQTPPPLSGQAMAIPPLPDSRQEFITMAEPKRKNKSTWKIIFWSLGILIFLFILTIIGHNLYEQNQYGNTKSNESMYPERYLSLDVENVDFNNLTGFIYNSSKYTTYGEIQIKISYYDKNGQVLQSNVHAIDGTYYPQSSTPFNVKIRLPQGIKNFFKTKNCTMDVIDAKVKYN